MGCQWESPALGGKRWHRETAAKVIFSSLSCPAQGPGVLKGRTRDQYDLTSRDRVNVENVISHFPPSDDHMTSFAPVAGKWLKLRLFSLSGACVCVLELKKKKKRSRLSFPKPIILIRVLQASLSLTKLPEL